LIWVYEILFIAIIALLFIGPDKLPETLKISPGTYWLRLKEESLLEECLKEEVFK